jgi:hypothetical protein
MHTVTPPRLLDELARALLPSHYRDAFSGDLLEQYRLRVHPERGRARANLWYLKQILVFVFVAHRFLAVLLAAAIVTRTTFDWFVPTDDFHARANVSTTIAVVVLLAAGFVAAWRSRSVRAGLVAGILTATLAAVLGIAGTAGLLAISHDEQTLAAIRDSGGLSEALTLPLMLIAPGFVLGTFGGVLGRSLRGLRRNS